MTSTRTAGLLVVIVALAAGVGHQLRAFSPSTQHAALGEALPGTVWPAHGQAAVQVGHAQVLAGPNQHVAAIASVANTSVL